MWRSSLLIAVLLATVAAPAPAQEELFTIDAAESAGVDTGDALPVTVRPQLLQPDTKTQLSLPLPDGPLTVPVEPLAAGAMALGDDQAAWAGRGEDGASVFILRSGSALEGQIQRGPRVYRLRSLDGRRGTLEIIDTETFREAPAHGTPRKQRPDTRALPDDPDAVGEEAGEEAAVELGPGAGEGDEEAPHAEEAARACLDTRARIDVLVLYTPAARAASGGIQAVEQEIIFAVARANLALDNSRSDVRLHLREAREIGFAEPAGGVDAEPLRLALGDPGDGVLDEVHGLRDAVDADLVSLLYEREAQDHCGDGDQTDVTDATATAHLAFSVVRRACAGSYLSFAHEIGHNIGARHDRAAADASTLPFNFGYVRPHPSRPGVTPWRTVMAYNKACADLGVNCVRVPWFSNPDVALHGDPTGISLSDPESAHNVHLFAQNGDAVARYRCATPAAVSASDPAGTSAASTPGGAGSADVGDGTSSADN